MKISFDNAEEMLAYIQEGNDLYSPAREQYVWLYNESGSIACAFLSEDDMVTKGHEMYKTGDDTLIFEELHGLIYDDPSCTWFYTDTYTSNLEFCESAYDVEWVDVKRYIVPESGADNKEVSL